MTCWKCGKETGTNEAECQSGCSPSSIELTNETIANPDPLRFVPIDWDKVKSFDDLKFILESFFFLVAKGSPQYRRLKRFLKD